MHVKERDPGDRKRLGRMIKSERDAMRRDRPRCVALAIDGRETLEIAARLGRSRRFVQRWVYAYRDRGLGAVHGDTAPGSARRMTPEQEARFIALVRRGATPEDGVSSLRGTHMRRILELEFGVPHSLNAVYAILHRNGFSCLSPRPRHPKQDPKKIAAFRRSAPSCEESSGREAADPGAGALPGRSQVRAAGNPQHRRGSDRLASERDPAERPRVDLGVRGGGARDGMVDGDDLPSREHRVDAGVPRPGRFEDPAA